MTSVTHIRFTSDIGEFIVIPLDQLRRAALRFTPYMGMTDPRTKFFGTMNSTTKRIHDQYVNGPDSYARSEVFAKKVFRYLEKASLEDIIRFVIAANRYNLTYGYGYFDLSIPTVSTQSWVQMHIDECAYNDSSIFQWPHERPEGAWVEIATYRAYQQHDTDKEEQLIDWATR
ncbi:hypothetical protein QP849_06330 [Alloscardovia omnicolens]|uniref:hypothetical protein n=1 Tax=Alloscardovia omnicolens TaxID=419015 RepID=UPI00254FF50A|nr:hypothetical protein [Alloscardovia omnicolens]MDK8650019.1 hypothetical protein [Alloscardovia omnicolens]